MLGLSPGKPARWVNAKDKEPVFLPPAGATVEVDLRWKDKDGKVQQVPATDWMLCSATSKPAPRTRWVFVGSDILEDGQYWADIEGERHHICLVNFASSVLDVPFKSSDKNALLDFVANTAAIPPLKTPVEVVISVVKGAETAPAARVSLSIDNLGRIEWEGQPISPGKIPEAARKFLSQHAQGVADVKIDARAMVWDREHVKALLEEAGVAEVNFRMTGLNQVVLPRTAPEASAALAGWKDRFAHARDYIIDPAEDAALSIQAVQARTRELSQLAQIWADYAAQLKELIRTYGSRDAATSQPAGRN
jgi:biopolymer transport protein ExbD